tara:strand:- start:694 stop:1032 length:339 start_codon:yes stop_codon:yes gene_type:complete
MSEEEPLPPVDEMPVLQDAVKAMKLDLAVSDTGEVYIFHQSPMPERVNWVQYDRELLKLYFISEKGRIQGVGMKVMKKLDEVIASAKRVYLIRRENGETKSVYEMPLVHQLN